MRRNSSSAFAIATAGVRRLRRSVALLACVFVLGWTVLSATHWHDGDDPASRADSAVCALCLAMPAGAAPPQQHLWLAPSSFAVRAQTPPAPPLPATGSSSAYQSRAPPAA